jgi:hypothetical protein
MISPVSQKHVPRLDPGMDAGIETKINAKTTK